ncbi:hypothetical protein J6590_027286 [Homalodisca vitripennis]|nr:hypothetical protein J6590_027286 [Homalodisca vitripennis]
MDFAAFDLAAVKVFCESFQCHLYLPSLEVAPAKDILVPNWGESGGTVCCLRVGDKILVGKSVATSGFRRCTKRNANWRIQRGVIETVWDIVNSLRKVILAYVKLNCNIKIPILLCNTLHCVAPLALPIMFFGNGSTGYEIEDYSSSQLRVPKLWKTSSH